MKKFKKILGAATAAALLATSVVSAPASADFRSPEGELNQVYCDENLYQVSLFLDGGGDPNNVFDRGIDLSTLGGVGFTFFVPEDARATFDGQFGGAVGVAIVTPEMQEAHDLQAAIDNGELDPDTVEIDAKALENVNKYFWQSSMFYGISDPDAKIDTQDADQDTVIEALGDYFYYVKGTISNPIADGAFTAKDIAYVNAFMQGWGDGSENNSWTAGTQIEIIGTDLYDLKGNIFMSLDNTGNVPDPEEDEGPEELPVSDKTVIVNDHLVDGDFSGNNYITELFSHHSDQLGKPLNLGLDLSKLGGVAYTFQINEKGREHFLGSLGGAVGAAFHPADINFGEDPELADKYGWPSEYFWGVLDVNAPYPNWPIAPNGERDENLPKYIGLFDPDEYAKDTFNTTFVEPLGNYTYRVKGTFPNPIADGICTDDQIWDVIAFLQIWDNAEGPNGEIIRNNWDNYYEYVKVTRVVLYDTDNKPVLAIDGNGNVVKLTNIDSKDPVLPKKPTVFEPNIDKKELEGLDEETKQIVQDIVVEDTNGAFDKDVDMNISDIEKTDTSFGFDITFTDSDGKEVQPKSKVTVKVPVPEFLQDVTFYLYHIDSDGKVTSVKFEIKDGVVIFEAESFSKYILSTEVLATEEPADTGTGTGTGNPPTGNALALVPVALVAGLAIAVSKKRK